mgnify:CR=1 FL=1
MRLLSILARVGLVFLGAVLVTAVSADIVWEDSSDYEVTTSDLAEALFGDWALPLLALGFLMAMAMVGAAYLVRDLSLIHI